MPSPNNKESLWKRLVSGPPVLFLLAALFHILITITAITSLYPIPLQQIDWLRPLGMVLFSVLSVLLCLMRKVFAIAYVALTIICAGLLYTATPDTGLHIFGSAFFPFNLILSFFVLLFFKRFR